MQTIHDAGVTSLDLSPLFAQPIRRQTLYAPYHPGQANYIWEIQTDDAAYIVRSPRLVLPPDEDFWQGALRVFESHTLSPMRTVSINQWLEVHSTWRIPRTYRVTHWASRDFLIVERLPGDPLQKFSQLSYDSLVQWGRTVALLHQCRRMVFGPPQALWDVRAGQPIDQFSTRLLATMRYLTSRYYSEDPIAQRWAARAVNAGFVMPTIPYACPMMLDWDPSQMLAINHQLTGLVDTELYVVGPPQLELCSLEYLLDRASARAFRRGYNQIAPFPDLHPYRLLFRLFLRLMSFRGPVPWNQWFDWPAGFAETKP
ncbi:MAG: aminoglycoside phosphotransferase [Sulfobacillus acidophilus]|uniref:Aminoglycoside phosphotransferase n=1 Tax=Sulfobacillus acidophilus TaxID=53633 RepID=A0A2T2WDA7_9FIRM|nr:MAG: aminoglycoside phosphotransferase [Sulfobacillus acidophilus]